MGQVFILCFILNFMGDVRNLEIYQLAKDFAVAVDFVLKGFSFRVVRLVNQVSGSSISVFSNIREGHDSVSKPEYLRFLGYARRSLGEALSQLNFAFHSKYLDESSYKKLKNKGFKLSYKLNAYIDYISRDEVSKW